MTTQNDPRRLERRILKLTQRAGVFREKLEVASNARLWCVGLFFIAFAAATTHPEWRLELGLVPLFFLIFSIFVLRTRRLRNYVQGLDGLQVFFTRQRARQLGRPCQRFSDRSAEEMSTQIGSSSGLSRVRDLGVLGSHSLFSLIDETLTDDGESKLLSWLEPKPRPIAEILARQNLVQRLRGLTWFFTRLTLVAHPQLEAAPKLGAAPDVKVKRREDRLASGRVLKFIAVPFVEGAFGAALTAALLLWLIMVATCAAYALDLFSHPVGPVVAFAGVNLWAIGHVGRTFKKGLGLEVHLNGLTPLFTMIERRAKRDQTVAEIFPVTTKNGPASEARKLTFILSVLGIESNPLAALLINLFLPWTMLGNFFLERQRKRIAELFPVCFAELAEFEVVGSLLILDHYQTQTYPEFRPEPTYQTQALYHPLIERQNVVANDFRFQNGKSCGLLTGSNMAGKSTFLRTVGLNQLLAQMGAPVFAKSLLTCAFQIESCIEVSDSLRDGFSYFYAEVRRLRDLLRVSELGAPTLYLIDEIFRGTNNRERHIGSRSVIRHLARQPGALGFISTHDLELVVLEETEPRVTNLHFREDFEDGKMVFHYRLQAGPCPTSNALKIMQAEGIEILQS